MVRREMTEYSTRFRIHLNLNILSPTKSLFRRGLESGLDRANDSGLIDALSLAQSDR